MINKYIFSILLIISIFCTSNAFSRDMQKDIELPLQVGILSTIYLGSPIIIKIIGDEIAYPGKGSYWTTLGGGSIGLFLAVPLNNSGIFQKDSYKYISAIGFWLIGQTLGYIFYIQEPLQINISVVNNALINYRQDTHDLFINLPDVTLNVNTSYNSFSNNSFTYNISFFNWYI